MRNVFNRSAFLFWTKIDSSGGANACWPWMATKARNGYGIFQIDGKREMAHVTAYRSAVGDIPDGWCVLHECDNRSCCNPAHLFPGTRGINNQDRHNKGRDAIGVTHGRFTKPERTARGERCNSKLTSENVVKIRTLHRSGLSQTKIAKMFNVRQANISSIVLRKTWAHL